MATIINRSMFPLSSGINNIMGMKERYDKLQTQLSSGMKASNLAEMGSDRYFDLALRQRVSRIDSYQGNIKTVNLRLNVLDQTVGRLDAIEADARAATMSGSGGQASLNFQTTPTLASARFDEVMTLMNVDIAGRYLFGGAKTENKPVEDAYYALNGRGSQAGFKQVAGERKLADLGTSHLGRLTIGTATDTTTLAEDGTHPFGMKLATASTTSANIVVNQPAGSPPALTVQFGATLPVAGETVTVNLTMPDGTSESITLTAVDVAGEPGSFVIGADADATAAAFGAALQAQVQTMAEGRMVTASAYAASENFFYGQGGQPMRVDGPPYDTATALVAGTDADTIFWYKGEDSTDPRTTVTAKVGESTSVAYGVQANEAGLVNLVQSLAAMAIQVFSESDPTATDRYMSMVARNTERLAETGDSNGSIAIIAVELGLAKSTAGAIDERHTDHKAQLGNMLQDIEEAPTEQVAMEILALKTRLEASYQTTALLSQLSLINYLK
jgi:flagellin-like hook-associated protein FlgL